MSKHPVFTSKENLVKNLDKLAELSQNDPYKKALYDVLLQLAGMTCEAATYTSIITEWERDV